MSKDNNEDVLATLRAFCRIRGELTEQDRERWREFSKLLRERNK